MTEDSAASNDVIIPADLSPVDAVPLRESILAALEGAEGDVGVDLDGEKASMCALQMLVATSRTATNRGISLRLSSRAEDALSGTDVG